MRFRLNLPLALVIALAGGRGAAEPGAAPGAPQASAAAPPPAAASVAGLRWRTIGPATTGGRTIDIAVVEKNPDVVYAATASGGVWKTTNRGHSWTPVFEHERTVSVGAIALAGSDPNIVWVGTGEANSVRSSSWGDGVYRSDDGGKTWKHLGLEGSRHIGRIVVHPTDPRIVYVAALGSLFGPNPERGLYKSTDGGTTWTKVLSASDYTGAVDVAMDPRDPNVLYAALFQRERRNWSFIGGGPESGLFRSGDAGATWQKLSNGLPKGDMGRIGIAICRSQPDRVYAAIVAPDGGLFRSDDRGATWVRRNASVSTHWYYGQVVCDPNDPDRIYIPQTRMYRSEDGGATFATDIPGRGVHGDHHIVWVDPANSDHLILGNDGGVYMSNDRGASWEFVSQLPVAQYYAIGVDMQEPFYYVYGGLQDNSSWAGPSGTRNTDGIVNADWFVTAGGDGFYSLADPTDAGTIYAESQYGRLLRMDARTGEKRPIAPEPPRGTTYRWNWSSPLLISPHDHQTLYFAANVVFKSSDRGESWRTISPDLTRQLDYHTLPLMGHIRETGIALHESTADYSNISTIAESPRRAGLLAVGTDDGLVQVSRDDGATWSKTEAFPGVPRQTAVSRVLLSHFAEGTLYAAFDGHRDNDFRPFVCRSVDYGKTWQSMTSDLPAFGSTYALAEALHNPNLLFAGTEFGIFATFDGGAHWISLKNNLPTVAVHDIVVHPRENDLVIGTHGRGIWILDDVSPLEELPGVSADLPHVFPVRAAMMFHRFNRGRGSHGNREYAAPNPPDGLIVTYLAGTAGTNGSSDGRSGTSDVEIVVRDEMGSMVRRLSGPAGPGLQRVVWDLRHEPPPSLRTVQGEERGQAPRGPFVLPGQYTVEVRHGDAPPSSARALVKPDPLISWSEADRKRWHSTLLGLVEMQTILRAAIVTNERIGTETAAAGEALRTRSGDTGNGAGDLRRVADAVAGIRRDIMGAGARSIAEQVHEVPLVERLPQLYAAVEASTALPTADQRRMIAEAHAELKTIITRLNGLLSEQLPALEKTLGALGVRWTPGRPLPMPSDDWIERTPSSK
jgi:photosystem II stability/assembly factor-like uncharacterized protein